MIGRAEALLLTISLFNWSIFTHFFFVIFVLFVVLFVFSYRKSVSIWKLNKCKKKSVAEINSLIRTSDHSHATCSFHPWWQHIMLIIILFALQLKCMLTKSLRSLNGPQLLFVLLVIWWLLLLDVLALSLTLVVFCNAKNLLRFTDASNWPSADVSNAWLPYFSPWTMLNFEPFCFAFNFPKIKTIRPRILWLIARL